MSDYEKIESRSEEPAADLNLKTMIDFVWKGFVKFWWLPLELALILGAFYWMKGHNSYHPSYQTSAIYMVESKTEQYSSVYRNATTTSQVVSSFSYILNSTSLKNLVLEDLELDYMPASITASTLGSTNMMTLTATGSDPVMAYRTLNAVVEHFSEAAERIVGAVSFKIVDMPVIPTEPYNSSSEMAQAKKGMLYGAVLGLGLILLYAATRNTILSTDAIRRRTSLECLGEVERVGFKKRKNSEAPRMLVTEEKVSYSFKETYRSIRTRVLRQCEKHEARVLLVTSTFPGEGKTTTSINLALSIADSGYSVALVDCDMRKPSVYKALGITPGNYDLVDVLKNGAPEKESMIRFQDTHLKVIGAKNPTADAAELIDSQGMSAFVEKLRHSADYVILDSPPVDMMSDAVAAASQADGLLFVIRHNYGRSSAVFRSLENIHESGKPILGYVFNGVEHSFVDSVYHYGTSGSYGYGKYGKYGKYGRYGKYGKYGSYGSYGYGSEEQK